MTDHAQITLENRLRALEDRQAVVDLITAYGPAVDSCDGARAAALWAENGRYVIGTDWVLEGRDEIAALTEFPQHQAYVAQGCAHLLSPHRISIDGDSAHAEGYSMVFTHEAARGTWTVARLSANSWTFERGPEGWRVAERRADLLDGSVTARALLGGPAMKGPDT